MPIITIAQDCLLNRRSCVNNIHTQSLDLYFIAYFKIQFKVDWILKNRLRSKVLKICEGKTHNNGNENNFEWPTMHKKNDAKKCENDTMLLQETLLQQRKICFLWNSKRKNIQPMKLQKHKFKAYKRN